MVKLTVKVYGTALVICSHSREGKTLSYSQINTVGRKTLVLHLRCLGQ